MHQASALWAALRDALNLTGVGALITGLFLITRGRSDAKLTMKQLQQKIETDEHTSDREDSRLIDGKRTAAFGEQEKINEGLRKDRDYWEARCGKSEAELNMRNEFLAEIGTFFPEIKSVLSVPGTMMLLRDRRLKFREDSSPTLLSSVDETRLLPAPDPER